MNKLSFPRLVPIEPPFIPACLVGEPSNYNPHVDWLYPLVWPEEEEPTVKRAALRGEVKRPVLEVPA